MEICLLGGIWYHWPTVLTNKYLLNGMDLPFFWKPAVTLAPLIPYAFSGSSFSIFFSPASQSPMKAFFIVCFLGLLLFSPPVGTFSYSNYHLHADVSQICAICIPVSLLRVKFTWSTPAGIQCLICTQNQSFQNLIHLRSSGHIQNCLLLCLFSQLIIPWSKKVPKPENWELFWLSLSSLLPIFSHSPSPVESTF